MVEILVAVGNPDVGHAGRALAAAEGLADLAAGDAVLHPEAADALVAMAEREAVGGLRMGEERGIEVEADLLRGRPVHPTLEMLGRDVGPIDFLAAMFQVDRVNAEAVLAGDKAHGLVGVGAKLVGVPRPAGIVAGGHDAAGQRADALEAGHVVPLPALHRDGHFGQPFQGRIGIDAQFRITLFRQRIRFVNVTGRHDKIPPGGKGRAKILCVLQDASEQPCNAEPQLPSSLTLVSCNDNGRARQDDVVSRKSRPDGRQRAKRVDFEGDMVTPAKRSQHARVTGRKRPSDDGPEGAK